ncbi:ethanolamine ammonia-lyase reactivating factor EutA [Lishizhenia sp.]|uniref:Ppx/GppA phosphatase family protein n=1 Tax=Lishizhenia sp. TaxID=2497594 RepID=UPI00299CE79C|nr:ethanolamine ammonia-lyase reactivating factor EutA [Lishizhenia sp.]MDX1445910.1 ethanolamine ammonia-lyase reactivating factor EutA [Lishizhenia sp.]
MIYGAIDIGTNAARLLIGQVTKNNGHSYVKKISYTRIPLRLGLEVFEDGIISLKKEKEFVKTMQAFKLIAEVFDVAGLRCCATSAMREAKNGKEIKEHIEKEVGVKIEIIGGKEEADIIFSTFFLLNIDKDSPFIVIDVGGGSTEISVFEDGQKVAGKSFRVGTIRMMKHKESKQIWKSMKKWIADHVDGSVQHKVFATGGNINKVHKLLGKQHMEPIKYRELDELHDKLAALDVDQRAEKYQLKPDRADVIVPACEIYLYAMTCLKSTEMFVPKIGLSDGIIHQLHANAEKNKAKKGS